MTIYEIKNGGTTFFAASAAPNGPLMEFGGSNAPTYLCADYRKRSYDDRTWDPRTAAKLFAAGHTVAVFLNASYTAHVIRHEDVD